MTLTVVSGAVAGLVHVLTGPDHLTAVAPLAMTERRRGWVAGWTWGLGHSLGVVSVAVSAILLRDYLPPVEALSRWGERAVGAALILVGLWALRRSFCVRAPEHIHGASAHAHLHVLRGPQWFRRLGHAHASFGLGVLHGIAGSSHFLGVLPALALPNPVASLTYIGAFGVGTVAAMTLFAGVTGWTAVSVANRWHQGLMMASSVAALAVGAFWMLV